MTCTRGCCATQTDHYRSLTVTTPSVAGQKERRTAADLDAYRRLRQSGVQPKGIDGAAVLEREAKSVHEIQQGHLIRNDRLRREVDAAHANTVAPSLEPSA